MTRNYLKDDVDLKYKGTFSVKESLTAGTVTDSESVNGFKQMLDKYLDPGL